MWENGNNSTGLPAMEATTQNPLRELLKSKTVDAGKKTLAGKQEVHTFMGRRAMCLQVAQLPPQPAAPKYK